MEYKGNAYLWEDAQGNRYISMKSDEDQQCYFDKVDEEYTADMNDGIIYGMSSDVPPTDYSYNSTKQELVVNYNHIPDITGVLVMSAATEYEIPIVITSINIKTENDLDLKDKLYIKISDIPTNINPNGVYEGFIYDTYNTREGWNSINPPYPDSEYSEYVFQASRAHDGSIITNMRFGLHLI